MSNHDEPDYSEEVNGIAFRDILMNTLLGVFAILVAYMMMIQVEQVKATAEPPGNLTVSAHWPEGNTDVDLWVTGPAEPVPVGYSNKGGVLWNLLRDDLGTMPDATSINYENAYTRGIVAGTYTVNLHCYRCPQLPVVAEVLISINDLKGGKGSSKTILTSKVEISRQGQEKTVATFKMDDKGVIDKATMNNVYRPLRSAEKAQLQGAPY